MLHQYQNFCEELRSDLYSKYQCQERNSSASSTSSSGSGGGLFPKYTQMSRHVLASTLQKNCKDSSFDETDYDDSLTNLSWLHNVNPNKINEQLSFTPSMGYPRERAEVPIYSPRSLHMHLQQSPQWPSQCVPQVTMGSTPHSQPDYKNNPNLKPPFSYAILISWAMKELGKPKISLADIYSWIIENFAHYRQADSSWQNSIRHNLSLGKCFEKVPRRKDEPGKGGFWRINPQHAKTLDMNLSKIKYNPSTNQAHNIKSENTVPGPRFSKQISTSKDNTNSIHSTSSIHTKRSRKSPLTVTQEDWESYDSYNEAQSRTSEYNRLDKDFSTFDQIPLVNDLANLNSNACFDLSPFDNSSSDSNNFCPSSDNDFSMNNFDENSLDDILNSPMLLDKDHLIEHDDFRQLSSNSDFSDLFFTSKDDLQDLNCLLGIF